MSPAIMIPATFKLQDLVRRSGQSSATMKRNLRRRGIRCEGRSVMLIDLRESWPRFYDSLVLSFERAAPRCPSCGGMTQRSCLSCEFRTT